MVALLTDAWTTESGWDSSQQPLPVTPAIGLTTLVSKRPGFYKNALHLQLKIT